MSPLLADLGHVQALNTWAHCAICSARILPVEVLCPACEQSPKGKAFLVRKQRREGKGIKDKHALALRLAAFHRQEALKWLRIAKETRDDG